MITGSYMKKFLVIAVCLIWHTYVYSDVVVGLKCGKSIVTVDKKYIYQIFVSGDIDKYKITNKDESYFAGTLKTKNTIYEVFLDLSSKSFTVNSKDVKTGIVGSYKADCL